MNTVSDYVPQPLDTSDVSLPADLEQLLGRLARNTHDVWAARRMKEGWTYGPKRDDQSKKHPCLVPYDELSDEEKQYDLATSSEALKLVLALGYEIRPTK